MVKKKCIKCNCEKEFIEANNYKNLQPLWWQDNLEKRNG